MGTIKKPNLQYYISQRGYESIPSPAEEIIIEILDKYSIEWLREVSFKRLTSKSGVELRYDFYIPKLRLMIEYDGAHHKTSISTINNDKWKNWFCYKYKYTILRYSARHYYSLEDNIKKDLNSLFRLDL